MSRSRTPAPTPVTDPAYWREKGKAPPNEEGIYLHPRGYYCKKRKGVEVRLGRDWGEALRAWRDIKAGVAMAPDRPDLTQATVRRLCDGVFKHRSRKLKE